MSGLPVPVGGPVIVVGGLAVGAEVAAALGVVVAFSVGRQIAKKAVAHFKEGGDGGKGEKIETVTTFEQARNKALELIGDIDPHAAKPNYGKFGPFRGKITGRKWFGDKVKWYLDWDLEKGAHINVKDFRPGGAGKVAIRFKGGLKEALKLLKHFN